eukprot:6195529-Pleurochrysis_carterae.AAC.1
MGVEANIYTALQLTCESKSRARSLKLRMPAVEITTRRPGDVSFTLLISPFLPSFLPSLSFSIPAITGFYPSNCLFHDSLPTRSASNIPSRTYLRHSMSARDDYILICSDCPVS